MVLHSADCRQPFNLMQIFLYVLLAFVPWSFLKLIKKSFLLCFLLIGFSIWGLGYKSLSYFQLIFVWGVGWQLHFILLLVAAYVSSILFIYMAIFFPLCNLVPLLNQLAINIQICFWVFCPLVYVTVFDAKMWFWVL